MFLKRDILPKVQEVIGLRKSALLLGPRQTGKTTLVKSLPHDVFISFIKAKHREVMHWQRILRRSLGRCFIS
jgi:predicted AAA+ superfamily ATPase